MHHDGIRFAEVEAMRRASLITAPGQRSADLRRCDDPMGGGLERADGTRRRCQRRVVLGDQAMSSSP
jgi:hypothetical protein